MSYEHSKSSTIETRRSSSGSASSRPGITSILKCAVTAAAFSVVLAGQSLTAMAQSWPSSPVTIIVPSAAGGTSDIFARLVGEELSAAIGQPVVVENRPGAGGHLGGAAAASSKPDGYTISICGFLTHSVGPLLFKDLSYDPMKDLPPLTTLAISPNVLVARKSLGVNSLDELIALAKEQPGKLTYSSGGIGSTGHISGELVKQMAGVDITHVAYKNSPDSVNAVTTGEVDFTFFTVPGLSAAIKDGNVVPLAVTSKTRSNAFPDVPTLDESGFAGFDISAWFALCAPAGLPDDVAGRLQSELSNVLENDEMKSKIEGLGMQPHFLNMADTISMAQDEINRLTPVVEKLLSQN